MVMSTASEEGAGVVASAISGAAVVMVAAWYCALAGGVSADV